MEWIGGHTPEAFLYTDAGTLITSFILPDVDAVEIGKLLAEKGFQLKKKKIELSEALKVAFFQGKKYSVFSELLTWESSLNAALAIGGRMLSIGNVEQDEFINNLLVSDSATEKHYWIGATDSSTEGAWTWYGESELTYTGWAEGEPNNGGGNENCAVIKPSAQQGGWWNDRPCGEKHQLIVEFDIDAEKAQQEL